MVLQLEKIDISPGKENFTGHLVNNLPPGTHLWVEKRSVLGMLNSYAWNYEIWMFRCHPIHPST